MIEQNRTIHPEDREAKASEVIKRVIGQPSAPREAIDEAGLLIGAILTAQKERKLRQRADLGLSLENIQITQAIINELRAMRLVDGQETLVDELLSEQKAYALARIPSPVGVPQIVKKSNGLSLRVKERLVSLRDKLFPLFACFVEDYVSLLEKQKVHEVTVNAIAKDHEGGYMGGGIGGGNCYVDAIYAIAINHVAKNANGREVLYYEFCESKSPFEVKNPEDRRNVELKAVATAIERGKALKQRMPELAVSVSFNGKVLEMEELHAVADEIQQKNIVPYAVKNKK